MESDDSSTNSRCPNAVKLWVRNEYGPAIERVTRLEEKHAAGLNALSIQSTEYARRLDELNHAHEKHEKYAATFVSEDKFNTYKDSVQPKLDEITQFMAVYRGSKENTSNYRHVIFEVITLLIAAAAIAAAYFSK